MKTIATFEIQFLQFLDEHADVVQALPAFAQDNDQLITLYKMIHRVRLLDAKAVRLQRTGKMGTYPSSLGQEAVSVGLGNAMQPEDVFCPYYRDQGAMLERGVTMTDILNYWGGDERGSDYAGPREDFPISVPIASQCLHACGVAFAMKYRQENRAAVTSIGEGGTSEGAFYEAMNLAGAWQLPVVFVVNNNQWAISVPRQTQTSAQTIAQKGIAAGIESLQVDGNDIIAVREAVGNALTKARSGNGPSVIEAITYRLSDHTTADDAKRYWNEAEVEVARSKEPSLRLRKYLENQGVWSDEREKTMHDELNAELAVAVNNYINKTTQPIQSIFNFLYDELPEALLEQYEHAGMNHG